MASRTDPYPFEGLRDLERHMHAAQGPDGSVGAQLAASVIVPGSVTMRRIPMLGVALILFGIVGPLALVVWAFVNRDDVVGFALDERVLTAVAVVGLTAVAARLVAVTEVAVAFRRRPGVGARTALAVVVVLALGAPVLWVALQANEARAVVADVFADGGDGPVFDPDPSSGAAARGVTTILLLGGDAGPGRWGMRTDTMILVMIDEASGRTSLISVPRNLSRLRFPPGTPLAAEFPDGFDDLANAVFTHVSGSPELVEHYGAGGLQPEAVALSEGIGYSLGVAIDDYALVNMQGFADLIDALGGVTLELGDSIPLPPTLPGERPLPASVGPGEVDMDGAMAIAYVRSRSADSDYGRMGRQRQLLAALGSQVSPTDALAEFDEVAGLLGDSLRTSLSTRAFADLLDRLGDNSNIDESVGLAPPLIEPGSPDYDEIRSIIDAVRRAVVSGQPSGYAS